MDNEDRVFLEMSKYSLKHTQKGFTPVELLVVIAIITLLLSVIMSSLKKAEASAKSVICKSNLRQWGIVGVSTYASDHDFRMPHYIGKEAQWRS